MASQKLKRKASKKIKSRRKNTRKNTKKQKSTKLIRGGKHISEYTDDDLVDVMKKSMSKVKWYLKVKKGLLDKPIIKTKVYDIKYKLLKMIEAENGCKNPNPDPNKPDPCSALNEEKNIIKNKQGTYTGKFLRYRLRHDYDIMTSNITICKLFEFCMNNHDNENKKIKKVVNLIMHIFFIDNDKKNINDMILEFVNSINTTGDESHANENPIVIETTPEHNKEVISNLQKHDEVTSPSQTVDDTEIERKTDEYFAILKDMAGDKPTLTRDEVKKLIQISNTISGGGNMALYHALFYAAGMLMMAIGGGTFPAGLPLLIAGGCVLFVTAAHAELVDEL